MSTQGYATKRSRSEDATPPPPDLPTQKKRIKSDPTTPKARASPTTSDEQKLRSRTSKLAKIAGLGTSPWPEFDRPTPEECQEINDLLASVHGNPVRPEELVDLPDAPAGCGETPNVLDALIRTVFSQATQDQGSTRMKQMMDNKYGRGNYRAVLDGTLEELTQTIESGGLANKKAEFIMDILEDLNEMEGGKGTLSLEYVKKFSKVKAMEELTKFRGVGIKTAACILLYCLKIESFAVDIHVLRISNSLGWLPDLGQRTVSRDRAFQHLDTKVPDHLKYSLHTLMVTHGRGCKKCGGNTSKNVVKSCPIDLLLDRSKTVSRNKSNESPKVVKGSGKSNGKGKGKESLNAFDPSSDPEDGDDKKSSIFGDLPTTPTKPGTRALGLSVVSPALPPKIKKEVGFYLDIPELGGNRARRSKPVVGSTIHGLEFGLSRG